MEQREQAQSESSGNGARALVGALIAVLGGVAAMLPNNPVMRAVGEVAPALAQTIPTLLTACGTILAAFSQPPHFRSDSGSVAPVIQLSRRQP